MTAPTDSRVGPGTLTLGVADEFGPQISNVRLTPDNATEDGTKTMGDPTPAVMVTTTWVLAGTAIVGVTGAGLAPHAVTTIAMTRAASADAADPLTRTGSTSDVSGVTSLGTARARFGVAVRILPPTFGWQRRHCRGLGPGCLRDRQAHPRQYGHADPSRPRLGRQ